MDAQRTPDELTAENELICEKLLGWKLAGRGTFGAKMWLDRPYGDDGEQWHTVVTPSFDNWADAGLTLDELQKRSYDARGAADVLLELGDKLIGALLTPAAIRAATIKYVRSLP
jgi:hypothetical protein